MRLHSLDRHAGERRNGPAAGSTSHLPPTVAAAPLLRARSPTGADLARCHITAPY